MRTLLFMLLLVTISSCASDDEKPSDDNTLIGKWQLIEQLSDPGDGSGTFQPITSDRTIEFFSDGTIISNGILCFMSSEVGDKESGMFFLTTDTNTDNQFDGEIIPNICTSRSARVFFDLPVNGNLILWYQCIEGCGQKFEKIN